MNDTLSICWPIEKQPLSLGNLLILRQEIELLARLRGVSRAAIFFTGENRNILDRLPYFHEALLSRITITSEFSRPCPGHMDWPLQDPEISQLPYSSLRRIALLTQITGHPPNLLWPLSIEEQAQAFYEQLKTPSFSKIISIHLKRQSGGSEESNADIEQWEALFDENRDKQFVLLGNDTITESLLALPNVLSAQKRGMDLSCQLAFCSISDGFMGMASGISGGAIFSTVPYVIFKHPSHHAEEMKMEIGQSESFPFARKNQKLWRKVDSIANLRLAMEILSYANEK